VTLDEPGGPVLAQRLIIALLFEDGLDTGTELAVRESIAQRLLSQHPTNDGLLLALGNTLVGLDTFIPARLTGKSSRKGRLRLSTFLSRLIL
jgi:hypothetical protein